MPKNSPLFALCILVPLSTLAQSVNYEIKGQIASSAISSAFAVGDAYTINVTLDYSAVSPGSDLTFASYSDAITKFTFSLDPGGNGNYAGLNIVGNINGSLSLQDDIYFLNDRLQMSLTSGYPNPANTYSSAASFGFSQVGFGLVADSGNLFDLVSGGSRVLSSVYPGPLSLSDFDSGPYASANSNPFSITFDSGNRQILGTITSIAFQTSSVPEPSAVSLVLGTATMALAFVTRRIVRRK